MVTLTDEAVDYTKLFRTYQNNWVGFAHNILNIRLDDEQQKILTAIQNNRKISVRSGHARGKDFVAAVASLCFLYLNVPSKVINTAPTGRQVVSIMMSEIGKIHNKASIPLGGDVLATKIKFEGEPDWFLEGFKAGDKATEAWTGFHSENMFVVVTEASGVEDQTFNAIEGLLTGNSKLLLVFNYNHLRGEAHRSTRDPKFAKFCLSCLDAPNVIARKIIYPGQVDYEWVADKINKPGWTTAISKSEARAEELDFEWEGSWYHPSDLFRIKVLGEAPKQDESALISYTWIEAANKRWKDCGGKGNGNLALGVDIAGDGRDKSVMAHRRGNVLEKMQCYAESDNMAMAGKIKVVLKDSKDNAYIDSIGEGSGTYKRTQEIDEIRNQCHSGKFSYKAEYLKDYTGEEEFINMRAYCYYALRDALNPQYDTLLAMPEDDELMEELTEVKWDHRSDGKIFIEPKDKLKDRIGRSPDKSDAVALTFFKVKRARIRVV